MTIAQDPGFGLSPTDSSEEGLQSYIFDEDAADLGMDDDLSKPSVPVKRSYNSRKGPEMADKRATHNAIERARRENLNGRFMTLAQALPSMANVKRPSKSVIVNKALDFVYDAQVRERALVMENNDLRRQVDQLRQRLGIAPLPPPAPLPGNIEGSQSAGRRPAAPLRKQSTSSDAFSVRPESTSSSPDSNPAGQSPSVPSPASSVTTSSMPPMFGGSPPVDLSSSFDDAHAQQAALLVSAAPFLAAATAPVHHHANPFAMGGLNPQALFTQQYQQLLFAQAMQAQAQAQAQAQSFDWSNNPAFSTEGIEASSFFTG